MCACALTKIPSQPFSAMMRCLMESLKRLTLKCGTDWGFHPFSFGLIADARRVSAWKRADCPRASRVGFLKEWNRLLKNNIRSYARMHNQAQTAQRLCSYSANIFLSFFHKTSCNSRVIHLAPRAVLHFYSVFFGLFFFLWLSSCCYFWLTDRLILDFSGHKNKQWQHIEETVWWFPVSVNKTFATERRVSTSGLIFR